MSEEDDNKPEFSPTERAWQAQMQFNAQLLQILISKKTLSVEEAAQVLNGAALGTRHVKIDGMERFARDFESVAKQFEAVFRTFSS